MEAHDHHATISREETNQKAITMGKVLFDPGIDSVTGILIGTDPFYLRRYPGRNGEVMHIVQARPDRSAHTATPAEAANRVAFGIVFGREKHREFIARTMKGQLEIEFIDNETDQQD